MVDDKLYEETLRSETVYSGRLLKVSEETVRLPNGALAVREVVKHPGVVAVVPLIDGDVVLVQQFRQACRRILLEVPAGTMRAGESPEECASRELVEETGFYPGRLERMFKCYVAPGYSSEVVYVYLATELRRVKRVLDDDEFINVLKVDLASALRMVERNEVEDAKSIAGLLYLKGFLESRGLLP